MAELADALDSKSAALHLLKPTHRYSAKHKVYQRSESRFFKLALLCSLLLIMWLQISESPARAQELPDAPKAKAVEPKHSSKIFWLGTAALATSKTFDAVTTRRVLNDGGWEGNPVFGRHPSPAKQGLINAAFFAGETFLLYKTERSERKWLRWIGRAHIAFTVEEHVRMGACNAGINTQGPLQNCRPAI